VLVIGISSCESSLERSLAAASNPCDPSCDPPTWCGVATTLCAGEEETPSLVEKLHSGFQLGDQERRLRCTRLSVEILVDELQFNIQGACTVASLSDFNTRGAKLRPGIYERVMQKPLRVALLLLN